MSEYESVQFPNTIKVIKEIDRVFDKFCEECDEDKLDLNEKMIFTHHIAYLSIALAADLTRADTKAGVVDLIKCLEGYLA